MKKKIIIYLVKIFWIFVLGSVFGFFAEMLYALVYTRTIEIRQGLVYGPFIQIYGIGAVAYYILISNVQEPKKAFLSGMIMGGCLEYLCSFFQEIFFGTISWDYSDLFMNLNGRTSLLYCVYWGIIALLYLKAVYPFLQKIESLIYKKWVKIFTIFMMLFVTFDIVISCMAGNRQKDRHRNIPPKNIIDEFVDKHYPDELLDKIYNNKKEICAESISIDKHC